MLEIQGTCAICTQTADITLHKQNNQEITKICLHTQTNLNFKTMAQSSCSILLLFQVTEVL
jgi:hypothetical protein